MEYTKQQFESIYKEHYQRMYLIAYSMLEDSESAKDIVNQVFTEIWYKKPEIRYEAIRIYLLSATKNQCLHALDKRKRQIELEEEYVTNRLVSDDAARRELLAEVHRIIDNDLTEQDRKILALHYDENMTYSETAKELGISLAAVNKHITRSLSKIRTILKITR